MQATRTMDCTTTTVSITKTSSRVVEPLLAKELPTEKGRRIRPGGRDARSGRPEHGTRLVKHLLEQDSEPVGAQGQKDPQQRRMAGMAMMAPTGMATSPARSSAPNHGTCQSMAKCPKAAAPIAAKARWQSEI